MSILLDPTQKPAPATTGGAQTPPPVSTMNKPQGDVSLNGQTALKNVQLGNQAQTAYQQAFPQRNPIQTSANQAAPVPQMPQPQKQMRYEFPQTYQYDGQVAGRPEWSADEYKDSTPDGVGRNFLKTFYTPPTEEDYRKTNESTKRILALGNALRHIGNIVLTSKGAPNQTFNDPVALAEQKYQTERAQRQKDELDKENRAYKQSQLDIARDKAAGDAAYRDFKIKLGIDNADRAERKAAADKAYKDFLMKSQDQNNESLQKAREKNAKLQEEKFEEQKRHNKVGEGQAERRTRATEYSAYNKGGGSGSGGSGGGKGRKPYGKFLGKEYATKADYDKAVLDYAQRNKIPTTYDKAHKGITGQVDGRTQTGRPISSIAAESERHYAKNAPRRKRNASRSRQGL